MSTTVSPDRPGRKCRDLCCRILDLNHEGLMDDQRCPNDRQTFVDSDRLHLFNSLCGRSSPSSTPRFCLGHEREWFENRVARLWFPNGCRKLACLRCSNYQARLLQEAIQESRPTLFITLTGINGGSAEVRRLLDLLMRVAT